LNTLDRDAALVASADARVFPPLYQHVVKGIRPDVGLFHIRNLLPGKARGCHDGGARRLGHGTGSNAAAVFDQRPGDALRHRLRPVRQTCSAGRHASCPRDNRHAEFRHRLIADHVDGRIADSHDRFFASRLTRAFGNQLLALGRLDQLTREETTDLERLKTTFVGSLATLHFALVHPDVPMAGNELVERAFRMEESIPRETSSIDRALFHYYFAQLFLRGSHGTRVDRIQARRLLLKSFEELPAPDTPGPCALLLLGVPEGHPANTEPFRERCA
jgi:hypothetical protein